MRRALVFQHAEFEGPALVAQWLLANDWRIETTLFDRSRPVIPPPVEEFDALVVMGGAMSVHQHRDFPWLDAEKSRIAQAVTAGVPTIGICLGAQLLADVLGGKVRQNPYYEIGWWPVEFTDAARRIFPSLPRSATFLHWHGDTFSLPPGAIHLAASEACPMQGFLWNRHVLALQFHPEADGQLAREFCRDSDNWPSGSWVQDPEIITRTAAAHTSLTGPILFRLLAEFFTECHPPDSASSSAARI